MSLGSLWKATGRRRGADEGSTSGTALCLSLESSGMVFKWKEFRLIFLHFLDSFIEYVKDGLKHMRVKFYIQGSEPGKQGTVHLEVKEVWGSIVVG